MIEAPDVGGQTRSAEPKQTIFIHHGETLRLEDNEQMKVFEAELKVQSKGDMTRDPRIST